MKTVTPRFRWRIVPAFTLLIVGALQLGLSVWSMLRLPTWEWFWMNHGVIAIAGIILIVAAVAWHRGKWWLAGIGTVLGFVLPSLRPVLWYH